MTFDDLDFELFITPSSGFEMFGSSPNGLKASHYFPNGYGISVARFPGTYGWERGLFEVAVLKQRGNQWEICYDTHITQNVIGHCTPQKVTEIIQQIENL
jgi:hypothetical protein